MNMNREVIWYKDSLKKASKLPAKARNEMLDAIQLAALGKKHPKAKPLIGIKAMEIAIRYNKDAYRGIYTLEVANKLVVVDVFQKKSKTGIKTPKRDLDRIRARVTDILRDFE